MYPLKHSLGTAVSTSLSSVYSYFTYMIGLTKRSHVAPKMQHVTFCDIIVRFDWYRTKRIDSVCGVTWIPLCARDGSQITWGWEETLSIHVVSTQCASGLRNIYWILKMIYISLPWKLYSNSSWKVFGLRQSPILVNFRFIIIAVSVLQT